MLTNTGIEETTVEETTGEETTTRPEKPEGGCESSVGSCFLLLEVIVPAVIVRKKKE